MSVYAINVKLECILIIQSKILLYICNLINPPFPSLYNNKVNYLISLLLEYAKKLNTTDDAFK